MKRYYNIERGLFLIKFFIIFINPANFSFLCQNVNINLQRKQICKIKKFFQKKRGMRRFFGVLRHSRKNLRFRSFLEKTTIENKEEVYF